MKKKLNKTVRQQSLQSYFTTSCDCSWCSQCYCGLRVVANQEYTLGQYASSRAYTSETNTTPYRN